MRKIKYKKGKKVQSTLLEYTGSHKGVKTEMQLFVYDTLSLEEFNQFNTQDLKNSTNFNKVNWLNIHGLNDIPVIQSIGEHFDVDTFMLGDILNTTKRTKLDRSEERRVGKECW